MLAAMARPNRQIRSAAENSWLGTVYPAMPAMATTMSTTGETMEASTAADPTTRPPRMEAVCPMGPGSRSPASCTASKASSMMRTSNTVEKGTSVLASEMDQASRAGIISG